MNKLTLTKRVHHDGEPVWTDTKGSITIQIAGTHPEVLWIKTKKGHYHMSLDGDECVYRGRIHGLIVTVILTSTGGTVGWTKPTMAQEAYYIMGLFKGRYDDYFYRTAKEMGITPQALSALFRKEKPKNTKESPVETQGKLWDNP